MIGEMKIIGPSSVEEANAQVLEAIGECLRSECELTELNQRAGNMNIPVQGGAQNHRVRHPAS